MASLIAAENMPPAPAGMDLLAPSWIVTITIVRLQAPSLSNKIDKWLSTGWQLLIDLMVGCQVIGGAHNLHEQLGNGTVS